MQTELMYRKATMRGNNGEHENFNPGLHRGVGNMGIDVIGMKSEARKTKIHSNIVRDSRETIHSGHFMVSDFEAEAQDDEDELAVPVPEEEATKLAIITPSGSYLDKSFGSSPNDKNTSQQLSIETSLNKLFQCMSLAYRQKLTSPKWNRFKGIRLRWKDKIRLNNVIWRCWHMQFILKQNTLVCQFASPLDVDTHNKPEAVVLEGKYWKRKLAAVTAEYKKWRMFYRNKILGWSYKDGHDMLESVDMLDWSNDMLNAGNYGTNAGNSYGGSSGSSSGNSMMVDEDYMELMTDTLFSTISSNQPLYFPDPREIARGASLADFIQPSLGPLQPNLDDFMDTLEPLHEFFNSKLPSVPEEEDMFQNTTLNTNYLDLMNSQTNPQMNQMNVQTAVKNEQQNLENLQYTAKIYTQSGPQANVFRNGSNPNESFGTQIQQNFIPAKEKIDNNKVSFKNNRTLQNTYQQSYTMEIQPIEIIPNQSQVQINALTDRHENFPSVNQNHQRTIRPLLPAPIVSSPTKPYKIVQPQQGYNSFKTLPLNNQPQIVTSGPSSIILQPHKSTPVEKGEVFAVPKYQIKTRNRSRSSSSLTSSNSRTHPPLVSAISDPALNLNNNVLLAQLLTNNNSGLYAMNPTNDKLLPNTSTTVKHIMPMLPPPTQPLQQQQQQQQPTQSTNVNRATSSPGSIAIQSQSQVSSLINSPSSPKDQSSAHSPQALSISPLHSPLSVGSPLSPPRIYMKGDSERGQYKEQRRVGHIHAEQKRRYNIKNGFDMLHSLIPQLSQNANSKLSKAVMLQKGADYIRQLRNERHQLKEEMESLKHQIECLNTSISNCQLMLPATGAPVSRHRTSKMKEMFDEYVRTRTRENWKFWIFSILLEPLMISFNTSVSTSSIEDLYRSTILWVEQHCSLVDLRPAVLNSLRYLCTATDILSDPARLPEEALAAVNHPERRRNSTQ